VELTGAIREKLLGGIHRMAANVNLSHHRSFLRLSVVRLVRFSTVYHQRGEPGTRRCQQGSASGTAPG
jgi:hypothetical protein